MQVSCAGLQCTPQLWTSCRGSMQGQAGPVLPARLQSLQVRQATKAAACRGSITAILQHERLCQVTLQAGDESRLHHSNSCSLGCPALVDADLYRMQAAQARCTDRHHHHCSCSLHWSRTQTGLPNNQEMGLETSPRTRHRTGMQPILLCLSHRMPLCVAK